jgi:hypothetical protein
MTETSRGDQVAAADQALREAQARLAEAPAATGVDRLEF